MPSEAKKYKKAQPFNKKESNFEHKNSRHIKLAPCPLEFYLFAFRTFNEPLICHLRFCSLYWISFF